MVNIDRILARLKRQRRGIDKAIAALEKLRSARTRSKKRGASKSRMPMPNAQRKAGNLQGRTGPLEHQGGTGIALVPPTKRVG